MKITLIGLGKMGSVLGKRLLNQQFDLTIFNRTREKMQPLVALGATGASSLEEAVKNAEVIITCLLDDEAVLKTVSDFVNFMPKDAIHIGTSTILPETSKKISKLHQEHHQIYNSSQNFRW